MTINETGWLRVCGTSACIEIRHQEDGEVHIRSTRDEDTVVVATKAEWYQFVTAIHAGEVA